MWMILSQNYAGSKQKSYKIMKIKMFATQGKVKPNTENMRLKLGGGKLMTVQVTKLPS
jgi:hypothetical protein